MSPNTSLVSARANTLAILQGKESLSSLIDELDSIQYEQVYDECVNLNKSNFTAQMIDGQYTVVKHAPMWERRIR